MTQTQLSDGSPDGTIMGQSATDLISFYGATPVVRRSGAAQTAGTVANTTGTYGFVTSGQGTAIVALVQEMRAVLVGLGLMAGS